MIGLIVVGGVIGVILFCIWGGDIELLYWYGSWGEGRGIEDEEEDWYRFGGVGGVWG